MSGQHTSGTRHTWREMLGQLEARGYRLTPQRQLILEALFACSTQSTEIPAASAESPQPTRHVTAEEIHAYIRERFPQINLSTVHRTLELLEELGLVTHAHFADHIARYHPVDLGQHHHLLCRACGGIWEMEDAIIHPLNQLLQERYGFEADLNHLAIFGLCRACRER
jgi:Fur family transcriptional regulator, ferric uptake regulator